MRPVVGPEHHDLSIMKWSHIGSGIGHIDGHLMRPQQSLLSGGVPDAELSAFALHEFGYSDYRVGSRVQPLVGGPGNSTVLAWRGALSYILS